MNAYIGKYIIFIYCAFTVMLGLGMGIIGIIVADTDRQLKRRYAELQQTQQQLAQAAKLSEPGVGTTVVMSLSVGVNQYESACVDH